MSGEISLMDKSNMKENFKSILINVVSNIIFQIFILLISGSGVIYSGKKVLDSLSNNMITMSCLNFLILIGSLVVIIVVIGLLSKNIKGKRDKKKYDYSNIKDYYFSDYEKHITIYNNGTGIIIHKFKVIAKDVSRLQKIRRKLNIEDGVKTAKFPSLEDMKRTDKSERFHDYGFWYKSDDDIISGAKEYYWDSKKSGENKKIKENPQEIRWIFQMDNHRLKKDKPYEICYVISVPGLAALENGKLKKELLNDPLDETSSSNMYIDHKIQNLIYTISFENGISIDRTPKCQCKIGEQDGLKELDISGKEEYDLLYTKYIFCIENPEFGSDISINWKYSVV